ncbi:DUF397 domain-containing protein [Streptomyces sp. NPDC050256]|uniref:DUF397 domain-containing protein n=1 Tax=unclassified Streptomyces TaxID=2593676 RepID=UPI0037ACED00
MITRIADASTLGVEWTKSSYSGADSNCVEICQSAGAAFVRDSKIPSGPALLLPIQAWSTFVRGLKQ